MVIPWEGTQLGQTGFFVRLGSGQSPTRKKEEKKLQEKTKAMKLLLLVVVFNSAFLRPSLGLVGGLLCLASAVESN